MMCSLDVLATEAEKMKKERPPTVHFPYVAGIIYTKKIKRMCEDFNIRVVFKSNPAFQSLLSNRLYAAC